MLTAIPHPETKDEKLSDYVTVPRAVLNMTASILAVSITTFERRSEVDKNGRELISQVEGVIDELRKLAGEEKASDRG